MASIDTATVDSMCDVGLSVVRTQRLFRDGTDSKIMGFLNESCVIIGWRDEK